jgi:hypothetical protein
MEVKFTAVGKYNYLLIVDLNNPMNTCQGDAKAGLVANLSSYDGITGLVDICKSVDNNAFVLHASNMSVHVGAIIKVDETESKTTCPHAKSDKQARKTSETGS